MDEPHDFQLLHDAQAGDPVAFEALYLRFEPLLTRFVRRMIGDAQDVQDIVQETLMTLYLHLDEIDPPEKLRPYVYRVARNRCYDRLRRSRRRETLDLPDDDLNVRARVSFGVPEEVPVDDAAHWLLLHMQVREAMERLPELQRQALILFAEEELSYQEIADVMGISIGTVKSRLFHAKRSLRRLLPSETLQAVGDEDVQASEWEKEAT